MPFSAFTDNGEAIDQETCERLFSCDATVTALEEVPKHVAERLHVEATRHAQATLHRNMEANSRFFREEQERLERWADDVILAAERALQETKAQIKTVSRQARQATTTQEQHAYQQRLRDLEAKQRSQRRRIFDVEDEIIQKRDALIDALEQRMTQRTHRQTLFTIRWQVV
jgi:predicted  nucleic acid-binding Zn-ribbon protein